MGKFKVYVFSGLLYVYLQFAERKLAVYPQ